MLQFELATADTELRAARALMYEAAGSAWATALDAAPFRIEHRARVRAAAVWITQQAVDVAEAAYRAGGSAAYASPIS